MKTDKIYLVGFMGAGKSTVARALGRRLGRKVEDIDERMRPGGKRPLTTGFDSLDNVLGGFRGGHVVRGDRGPMRGNSTPMRDMPRGGMR